MKYLSNKIKKININIKHHLYRYSTSFAFIVSYILYYLSLEKCFDGEELCGNNMKWIYRKVSELTISCEL